MIISIVINALHFGIRALRKIGLDHLAFLLFRLRQRLIVSRLEKICSSTIELYKNKVKMPLKNGSRKIYSLWLQGEENAPDIVRKCLAKLRVVAGDHDVVVLDESMLDYCDVEIIFKSLYGDGIITKTHYSDIIRLWLLKNYGGLWVDSTVLLRNLPEAVFTNDFYSIHRKRNEKLNGEYFNASTIRASKGYEAFWTAYLLASKPGGAVVSFVYDVLLEYWSKNKKMIDYFLIDYALLMGYKNIPVVRAEIEQNTVNNNGSVTALLPMLSSTYSEETMNKLESSSIIKAFKLSYKNFLDPKESNSFYHVLLK